MKFATRAVSVIGAAFVCGALGAGTANAIITVSYATVRQVLCSTTGANLDVSYTNAYGNTNSRENVHLVGKSNRANRTCITQDVRTGEYGDYVGTSIYGNNGGYVYCAIFVDGRKVAESVDDSSSFSMASC